MNHTKKKSGVPDMASGTPLRSVCGILCGQRKPSKLYHTKKSQKSKENTQNPKISGVILELLGGFEPPTSSLPTAEQRSNACCAVLSGHFCPKRMRSCELLSPLNPYRDLRQWVCVWVRQISLYQRTPEQAEQRPSALPLPFRN